MEEMEGIPNGLIDLMNELSNLQFLKVAAHRLRKINTATDEEMQYVDYIMYKVGEIAKKMRFNKLSAENKVIILQLVAKEGLDTSVFLTESTRKEDSEPPSEKASKPPLVISKPSLEHSNSVENEGEVSHPPLFQKAVDPSEMLAALNASKPSGSLRITFQNDSKSFDNRPKTFKNVLDAYETNPFESEVLDDEPTASHHASKSVNPIKEYEKYKEIDEDEPPPTHNHYKSKTVNPVQEHLKYRDISPSPPRSYNIRSKSRGRSRSRSRSGSPSRSRSKERGRYRARSRSKSRGRYRERSRSRGRHRYTDYY